MNASIHTHGTQAAALTPFADKYVGADNCFTLLRYAFAFCIFCNHLCYVQGLPIFLCYGGVFVQCFFVISGFLTMNSYVRRDDWRDFAVRRARRLLPAYVTTVLLCFVTGIVFTTLPLRDFFTTAATWKYLGANLVFLNFLQPTLPGVFDDHAMQAMNGSLWTMKIEVLFYISVPLVTWLIKRWRPNVVFLTITLLSWLWFAATHVLFQLTDSQLFYALNHQIFGELQFFYFPILLLWNRQWVRRHTGVLCSVAAVLLFLSYTWVPDAALFNFFTLPVLILTVAYRLEPFIHARRWKDVSYEFFLLRFPTLQVVVELLPGVGMAVVAAVSFPAIVLGSLLLNVWCKWLTKRLS